MLGSRLSGCLVEGERVYFALHLNSVFFKSRYRTHKEMMNI